MGDAHWFLSVSQSDMTEIFISLGNMCLFVGVPWSSDHLVPWKGECVNVALNLNGCETGT